MVQNYSNLIENKSPKMNIYVFMRLPGQTGRQTHNVLRSSAHSSAHSCVCY